MPGSPLRWLARDNVLFSFSLSMCSYRGIGYCLFRPSVASLKMTVASHLKMGRVRQAYPRPKCTDHSERFVINLVSIPSGPRGRMLFRDVRGSGEPSPSPAFFIAVRN
jgi:hypothetical protein